MSPDVLSSPAFGRSRGGVLEIQSQSAITRSFHHPRRGGFIFRSSGYLSRLTAVKTIHNPLLFFPARGLSFVNTPHLSPIIGYSTSARLWGRHENRKSVPQKRPSDRASKRAFARRPVLRHVSKQAFAPRIERSSRFGRFIPLLNLETLVVLFQVYTSADA